MNDLLAQAIAAHGGLDRWNTFNRVTATVVVGGGLFPMKGLETDPNPREMTVTLHEEIASISPFGQPDWRERNTPVRIAIETTTGAVVSERSDPRPLSLATFWRRRGIRFTVPTSAATRYGPTSRRHFY
jgi:hypothetical protein